ncbi:hypothetical protein AcV5_008858 [Taiwanofungus camphoratus]|nr:hypothetical protein AcV5_008858 [Antrodia cinnamomea]KAI0926377.1 hypothetical protein AcV5_008858 [Antrodia cinnamomea]
MQSFYGITSVQTYLYYTRYKDDSVTLRLLIFLLWLLDGLHQAFITHASYTYAVTDLGSPTDLLMPEWSVMASALIL